MRRFSSLPDSARRLRDRAGAPTPPPAYAWATFDRTRITAPAPRASPTGRAGGALTIDDPVRIASITKLVVALGVMRLVEQGRLDLDRDVSDYLGWRLRNPAFPGPADHAPAAALAPLLAPGRGRLCGAARDDAAAARSPIPPRSMPRIRPGTFFRYSNLNFPVIASVMERATGRAVRPADGAAGARRRSSSTPASTGRPAATRRSPARPCSTRRTAA